MPAFAVIADAYAGLGDLRLIAAERAGNAASRASLFDEARSFYEKSVAAWKEVPNPSRIGPTGHVAGDPRRVAARLASLRE